MENDFSTSSNSSGPASQNLDFPNRNVPLSRLSEDSYIDSGLLNLCSSLDQPRELPVTERELFDAEIEKLKECLENILTSEMSAENNFPEMADTSRNRPLWSIRRKAPDYSGRYGGNPCEGRNDVLVDANRPQTAKNLCSDDEVSVYADNSQLPQRSARGGYINGHKEMAIDVGIYSSSTESSTRSDVLNAAVGENSPPERRRRCFPLCYSKCCSCSRCCSCLLPLIAVVLLCGLGAASFFYRHHQLECDFILQRSIEKLCRLSMPPMRFTQTAIRHTKFDLLDLVAIEHHACKPNGDFDRLVIRNMSSEFLKSHGSVIAGISEELVDVVISMARGEEFTIDFREPWAKEKLLIAKSTLRASPYASALNRSYEAALNIADSFNGNVFDDPTAALTNWAEQELSMVFCYPDLQRFVHNPEPNLLELAHYEGSSADLYWSIRLSTHCGIRLRSEESRQKVSSRRFFQILRNLVSHVRACY